MRSRLTQSLAGACALLVAASRAGTAAPPDVPAVPPAAPAGQLPGVEVRPRPDGWDDAEAAGLPPGSRPAVLTWERAYALALVRARSARPGRADGLAETLDPKVLADQAARLGMADFARFRREFLAGQGAAGGTFRDPSGSVLDLLRRLQTVESARRDVAAHDALLAALVGLVAGESSNLSQLDVDRTAAVLQQARRRLGDALLHYRDRLDEVKVELGLSPHAAVVPDREPLAAFREVFEAADRWSTDPGRRLEELPRLVGRLPRLEDMVLDAVAGRPAVDEADRHPGRLDDVLSAAERAAVKNRGAGPDADGGLGLRARRRVRHLLAIRREFEEEKQALVLALRMKDLAFEQALEPVEDDAPPRASLVDALIRRAGQVMGIEGRLVDLWATFQAEGLALARDLSTLPDADWESFLGRFVPESRPRRVGCSPVLSGRAIPRRDRPPARSSATIGVRSAYAERALAWRASTARSNTRAT
jgi:hypothetical protein